MGSQRAAAGLAGPEGTDPGGRWGGLPGPSGGVHQVRARAAVNRALLSGIPYISSDSDEVHHVGGLLGRVLLKPLCTIALFWGQQGVGVDYLARGNSAALLSASSQFISSPRQVRN